jgi:hypothetical protein
MLVLLNIALWGLNLWPIKDQPDDIVSASAEYDYHDRDGTKHHFKGAMAVEHVDTSRVTPEPTVAPEPDRPCHHHWVNGPYFVMMAGIPWDLEKPSSIARIQHCTSCGLMRLNQWKRKMDRGSLIEGSSIQEKEMFDSISKRRREAKGKR